MIYTKILCKLVDSCAYHVQEIMQDNASPGFQPHPAHILSMIEYFHHLRVDFSIGCQNVGR